MGKKWCSLRLNWYRKSILLIEMVISIYIYIYVLIYVEFLASHFNNLSRCISKFLGSKIIEELSKRRRPRTLLISQGQKTCVKHCYVDFSSWYDFWFAISALTWKVMNDCVLQHSQIFSWHFLKYLYKLIAWHVLQNVKQSGRNLVIGMMLPTSGRYWVIIGPWNFSNTEVWTRWISQNNI